MFRLAVAALIASAVLAACETSSIGGGSGDRAWGLGPGYVTIGENKRFSVSYNPGDQSAMLRFTLVRSFGEGEEPPEEPVPDEWLEAAEAAAPEGCVVASISQVDAESWRVEYDCEA